MKNINNNQPINEDILVLYGTNRENSLTEQVGDYYAKLLKKQNINPNILKLTDLPDNFTRTALYEHNGENKEFNKLKAKIDKAKKIVLITPEYNGSFPGVLKAFIDGLEYPKTLKNKKIALVGVSKGPNGCILGISHLTDIFNHLGSYVLPLKVKINKIPNPDINEVLKNQEHINILKKQIVEMLKF